MALSMDEQRILDEMERKLADDDPLLASRLTSFGRPGASAFLRSRRARIVLSFLVLVAIAAVSLAVYALTPFRASFESRAPARPTSSHGVTQPGLRAGRSTGSHRTP
jgi:hypothetical protein